ncbi:DHH family phosphoesterase [Candidatus Pacearchaeota archaeon]|nr:DHH family phosphoesterase [Candidatus Pacearchaeota archaeon]
MEKEGDFLVDKGEISLEEQIKAVAKKFLQKSDGKEVIVVSHFDTDGITSAAIMIKCLRRLDKKFSIKIVKSLEKPFIDSLPKDKIILFLDLSSGSLNHIEDAGLKEVFIIDHHELIQQVFEGIEIINPQLHNKEKISSSGLTYLFCKEIDPESKKSAKLAVLGMIGDLLEKEIDKLNNGILEEGEIKKKRGLLIYPSTRPINRALEYCSNPYIPGVTGNPVGVLELLREAGIENSRGQYKSLMETTEEEMKRLVTSIMLRNPKAVEMIGDIFLIKFFNKLEDARELSAMVNACSRLGQSDVALRFCMEVPGSRKEAEAIHIKYKQHIISGLNFISKAEKIIGKDFVIINTKDQVKDTIVGTIASILSNSPVYEKGTIIITMAYYDDKIKVSARVCGRNGNGDNGNGGRNVREILNTVIKEIGGEVGGHELAAGCILTKDKEEKFIDALKNALEIELVKI